MSIFSTHKLRALADLVFETARALDAAANTKDRDPTMHELYVNRALDADLKAREAMRDLSMGQGR